MPISPEADTSRFKQQDLNSYGDQNNALTQVVEAKDYSIDANLAKHGLQLQQEATEEATSEPDPFAESDTANISLIDQKIADSESNILETREAADEEFTLDSPRVVSLGKLSFGKIPPGIGVEVGLGFGVIADREGEVYALFYNHDTDCIRTPMEEKNLLTETLVYDGPAKDTPLRPGVKEIQMTGSDTRLDSMQVTRLLNEYTVDINGQRINVPVLTITGFQMEGVAYDCPTLTESTEGRLGNILEGIQDRLGDIDLQETFESVGEGLGGALGNLSQGLQRGAREAFRN